MNNEANLIINYITSDPSMRMVTRVVATGEKQVYTNGQSRSFVVPHGEQVVVLKIGKNYNKTIYVSDEPVTIYASYDGEPHFIIDQPEVDMEYMQALKRASQNTESFQQQYETPVSRPVAAPPPIQATSKLPGVSGKAVGALICGCCMIPAPIGVFMALSELKNAGITYRYKWFTYVALGVCGFMTFYLVMMIFLYISG